MIYRDTGAVIFCIAVDLVSQRVSVMHRNVASYSSLRESFVAPLRPDVFLRVGLGGRFQGPYK